MVLQIDCSVPTRMKMNIFMLHHCSGSSGGALEVNTKPEQIKQKN